MGFTLLPKGFVWRPIGFTLQSNGWHFIGMGVFSIEIELLCKFPLKGFHCGLELVSICTEIVLFLRIVLTLQSNGFVCYQVGVIRFSVHSNWFLTVDSDGFLCSRMGFALRRIRLTLPSTGCVCPSNCFHSAVEWVAFCTRLGYFAVRLPPFWTGRGITLHSYWFYYRNRISSYSAVECVITRSAIEWFPLLARNGSILHWSGFFPRTRVGAFAVEWMPRST